MVQSLNDNREHCKHENSHFNDVSLVRLQMVEMRFRIENPARPFAWLDDYYEQLYKCLCEWLCNTMKSNLRRWWCLHHYTAAIALWPYINTSIAIQHRSLMQYLTQQTLEMLYFLAFYDYLSEAKLDSYSKLDSALSGASDGQCKCVLWCCWYCFNFASAPFRQLCLQNENDCK